MTYINRYRWDRPHTSIRDTRGPERVEVGQPDPEFKSRPVGFAPVPVESEPLSEPLVWQGDNA
jgi:hypothetical protein